MKILRPLVLTALMMLVQGLAVASTYAVIEDADRAAPAAMMAGMHCPHPDAGDKAGALKHPSCCNASCPNMLACAFSAMATPPMLPRLALSRADNERGITVPYRATAAFSGPSLRPPIPLAT